MKYLVDILAGPLEMIPFEVAFGIRSSHFHAPGHGHICIQYVCTLSFTATSKQDKNIFLSIPGAMLYLYGVWSRWGGCFIEMFQISI